VTDAFSVTVITPDGKAITAQIPGAIVRDFLKLGRATGTGAIRAAANNATEVLGIQRQLVDRWRK
jgi:hypothetical protein